MVQKTFVLQGEEASQMKSIAMLIQKASDYKSSIHLQCGQRRANVKSLLGLMSLAIQAGDEVTIVADGDDAEEAVAALSEWLQHPLGV